MADKNSNNKVIDGVRYKLSAADCKQLQTILSRATVVQDDKTPQVKSAGTSEKLNDDVVKRLVGHTNVVYYNFETKAWNTNKYNGYQRINQTLDTGMVEIFKGKMEEIPLFAERYEMAASVTMTMQPRVYPGWGEKVQKPQYHRDSTAVVGNIIVKNKKTGRFSLYCPSWIGVHNYKIQEDAAVDGHFIFGWDGATNRDFRNALLLGHMR